MEINPELQLARQYIEETGCNLFLTGRAGTGKTTFLRLLRQQSYKRMIVVAPTGVAAINAGGVTIHSFFQLPFAPYIPESTLRMDEASERKYRFGKEKIHIIRSLDLLVIDEISMVRADLLDNIDAVLRRYRNREKPFGGVQLLMIGDMQQLAPVVKDEERALLSAYYDTMFFFGSHTLQKASYVTVELKKVYRQSDTTFLSLLNKIRTNDADPETLAALNRRHIPHFNPDEKDGYITLTTHNYQSQHLNNQKLHELPGQAFEYAAHITGDFPEQLYPTEKTLQLKRGAQIMFIKNDTESPRRYYNGKIGRVWALTPQSIQIICDDWHEPITLERALWGNTQYTLNAENKEIEEKIIGTFEHFPVKTAWAITIHKSQGLTFDRVIINAGSSFAHGQVYVALSRCRTLEGLVLSTPLTPKVLIEDSVISHFAEQVENLQHDEKAIIQSSQYYFYQLLCELFDFTALRRAMARLERLLDEHLYRSYPKLLESYKLAHPAFTTEVVQVSDRFRAQYGALCQESFALNAADGDNALQERIIAAVPYFLGKLAPLKPLCSATGVVHIDNKIVSKRWEEAFSEFKTLLNQKVLLLEYARTGFTLQGYLKARAESVLTDLNKPAAKKPTKPAKPKGGLSPKEEASTKDKSAKDQSAKNLDFGDDILHPELFAKLRLWRNQKASEVGLPVYTVIQQKAMIGISNLLPSSGDELARIPYFGKKSTEKYGTEILEIVMRYRKKKGLSLL